MFQHGSSNPVRDSLQTIVFLYQRKTLPNRDLNLGPFEKNYQAHALTSLLSLSGWESLDAVRQT